jgi:hypothetical protein
VSQPWHAGSIRFGVSSMPTWIVSVISVAVGAVLTASFAFWKDRHEANRKRKQLEQALCGELLVNYSTLVGTLVTNFEFDHIKPTQAAFGGMFTFDALETAKAHGDVLYNIPHFAAIRTLYKVYQNLHELKGGGPHTEGAARDSVKAFETLFAQGELNQRPFLRLADPCAPNLKSRLEALSTKALQPGQ